ncbi:retention module-containing protein [Halomonas sp. BN3-1]|uniref:retention module-containing protein n=1 Tax=Halomonas sp. BN3-1 TaxID=2082393 RepID=UPI000D37E95C|nr:retention module-containing protein [Halomonas sp. BN3-1]
MPVTIATVSSLQGNAWVKRPNGDVIALEEGDRLEVGDIVITADGALVTLQFADGRPAVTLVDAQQVSLPEEMGQGDASSVEVLDQEQVAELLRLLESEVPDLLEAIEAPGVGESGGGAEEGFDFVRLLRISESVDPQSYSFGGAGAVESLEPVEGGGTPVADDEEVFLAEGEPDLPPIEEGEGSVSAGDNSVVEGSGQSVTGSVTVTAPAGVARVAVSGVDVSGASAATPVLIDGQHGTLAITGFDPDTGTIDYVYTEDGQPADHSAGDDSVFDRFEVVVTDNRGAQASDSLDIAIVDSVPTALDDDALIGEDSSVPLTGSVLGNDDPGEDGLATVSFLSTQGRYGSLIDNGDGTWSYSVDSDSAPVQALKDGDTLSETFSYTITDGDGDSDTATLTITIKGDDDAPPTVTIPDRNGPSDGADPNEAGAGEHSVVEGSKATVTGTMTVAAEAGITDVSLGGEDITGARAGDDTTHVTLEGAHGSVTVTHFDGASGQITYTYTEDGEAADHRGSDPVLDSFVLQVTDNEGDVASDSLDINILDTVPLAEDDAARVGEDSSAPVSGDLLDNDLARADGLSFEGFDDTSAKYGTFTDHGDGTWSYSVNTVNAAVQALDDGEHLLETFNYTVRDADGDISTATLTVLIDGSTDGDPNVVIQDSDGDVTAGDNSVVEGSGETVSGAMLLTASAGIGTATIAGSDITKATADNPVVIETDQGKLEIIGFDNGAVDYRYTENSQGADHSAGDDSVVDRFEVVVTDTAGESRSDSLDINILDTEPEAVADTTSTGEDTPVSYNVLKNDDGTSDTQGADGATLTEARVQGGDSVGSVSFTSDGNVTFTPAAGFEGQAVIDYTLTDGDGDTAASTLTVTVAADSTPTIDPSGPDGDPTTADGAYSVQEAGLDGGADQSPGSNAASNSETTSGQFKSSTGNDALARYEVKDKDGDWVEINGDGTTVAGDYGTLTVNTDGSWSYTLTSSASQDDKGKTGLDDSVPETFGVRVVDSDGDTSAPADLTIAIGDDGPSAVADTTSTAEDTAVSYNVLNNSDDTSDTQGADGATLTTATLRNPSQGSVSFTSDGSVTFTPAAGFEGQAVIDYTLTDGDGDTASSTLTVTVAADSTPTIDPSGPDGDPTTADGAYSVQEAGLNGGADQSPGSNAASNSETTDGQFQSSTGNDDLVRYEVKDKDGDWVEINGDGTTVAGDYGTLTVNTDGNWSYTLTSSASQDDKDKTGLDDSVPETFGVRVVDSDGDTSDPADLTIAIGDDGPSAVADTTSTAEDTAVSYNVLNNSDDTSDTQGADGATLTTAALRNPSQGSVSFTSDGNVTFTPAAGFEGQAVIDYTLTDGDGDTAASTLTVTVAADSTPTIDPSGPDGDPTTADGAYSVLEAGLDGGTNQPAGSNAASNSESTSGQFQSSTGNDDLARYEVQNSDGDWVPINADDTTVAGDYGTLTVNTDGSWSYTLTSSARQDDKDKTGLDDSVPETFGVRVVDSDGDTSDPANLTIDIGDDGPSAVADTTSTAEDTAVSYNVLKNDDGTSDTQGADGASLTTATLRNPSQGSVSFTSDGSVTFTPAAGFEGQAVIDYTLTDGDGDTASSTLTVTVAADSTPTIDPSGPDGDPATDDGAYSVQEAGLDGGAGQSPGSNAASNSETTDGQFKSSTGNDDLARYEVQNSDGDWVEINANGTTVTGDYGTLTVNTDGNWSYTLTSSASQDDKGKTGLDDSVPETFGVRGVDSDGDTSDPANLTIAIGDDGPSAVADTTSTAEDTAVSYNVLNNDDGTSDTQGADGATLTTGTLRNPSQGSVSFTSDGNVTFTPAAGFEGQAVIDYTLTDGDGDTASSTLTVTVAADSTPTIDPSGPDGDPATADGAYSVQEAGLDGGAGQSPGSDAASNSETTNGQFKSSTGNDDLARYEVQNSDGDWVEINADGTTVAGDYGSLTVNTDGSWSYTLTDNVTHSGTNQTGLDDSLAETFGVRVVDSDGDTSDPANLTIDIGDDGPSAVADTTSTAEDTAVSYNVLNNDDGTSDTQGADGATLTDVRVQGGASVGSVSFAPNGEITFTPAAGFEGQAVIDYTLTDGDGDTASSTLTVTVAADSTPTIDPSGPDGDPTTADGAYSVQEAGLNGGADQSPGSNAASNSETTSGQFKSSTGNDDLARYEVKDSDGNWVEINADGTTVTGDYGSLTVNTDGSWSYTLTSSASQDDKDKTGLDDSVPETFGVRVVDSDGDTSAPANLTIDIGDDGPSAVADTTSTAEDTAVSYNVLKNDDGTSDTQGADGATLTTATLRNPSQGSVSFTSDGNVTFTPAAGFEGQAVIDYTLTDGDGDTASSTLTVTVAADSTPTTPSTDTDPTTESPVATVDEDGLSGGNKGGTGDVGGQFTVATGNLGYRFGDDGAASSKAFQWNLKDLPDLYTADGRKVEFALVDGGHTVAGSVAGASGAEPVITIKLTDQATGGYEVTLHQAIEHAEGKDENDLSFNVGYTVTDADGSQADGKLSVVIDDDTPQAFEAQHGVLTSGMLGDVNFSDTAGADGADSVVFTSSIDGTEVASLNGGRVVTSNGDSLTYELSSDGKTLEAKSAGGDVAFEVGLTADGARYEVTVHDSGIKAIVSTSLSVADDGNKLTPQGNGHSFISFDGEAGAPDVLVSNWTFRTGAGAEGEAGSIVVDQGRLGQGSNATTGDGEVIRFDFVDNLAVSGSEASWDNHRGATHFEQTIYRGDTNTGGPKLQLSAFSLAPDEDSTSGNPYELNREEKLALQAGDVRFFNASGTDVTSLVTIAENADGSLSISEIPDGARLTLTSDEAFEALEFEGLGDKYQFTQGDDFAFTWLDQGLTLPLEGTDGDGDKAEGSLELTLPGRVQLAGLDPFASELVVSEANLADGSQRNSSELTRAGSFDIGTPDGLETLSIGGRSLALADLQALSGDPVALDTPYGTLTLTGYSGDASGGTLSYEYLLERKVDNDSQSGATDTEFADTFAVEVVDVRGNTASGELDVAIIDDTPSDFVADTGLLVTGSSGHINLEEAGADGLRDIGFDASLDGQRVFDQDGNALFLVTQPLFWKLSADGSTMQAVAGDTVAFEVGLSDDGSQYDVTSFERINTGWTRSDFKTNETTALGGSHRVYRTADDDEADVLITGFDTSLNRHVAVEAQNPGYANRLYVRSNAESPQSTGNNELIRFDFVDSASLRSGEGLSWGDHQAVYAFSFGANPGGAASQQYSTVILEAIAYADDDGGSGSPYRQSGDVLRLTADDVRVGPPGSQPASVSIQELADGRIKVSGISSGDFVHLNTSGSAPFEAVNLYGDTDANSFYLTGAQYNSLPEAGSIDIALSATDNDGDAASGTLTLENREAAIPSTPESDGDPSTLNPTATLDEDGLTGGNAGGSGDVAGEDTVTTGTLGYSFGGDGAAASGAFSWNVASLPGDLKTVDGRAVSFQLSSDGHTLTGTASDGSGGSEDVVTIALTDQSSGAYQVTLHQALAHAAGNDENDLLFDATYTIVDADGSQADGALSVVIDDDAPVAASDTNATIENMAPVSGNVIGGPGASSGDQADAPGADWASVTAVSLGSTTVSSLNADGKLVIQGQYGTLTLDAQGGYSYALDSDNAEVAALDKGQTVDESFTYTLTDGDGDASDANLTITVTATDDDALVVGTNRDNSVQGGGGNDVLIGDTGGKYSVVEPAQNYNLSFILDTSGSMAFELGDTGKTRLEVAVEALKAKLDELATFEGGINVQLVGFAETAKSEQFLNLSQDNVQDAKDFLDSLVAKDGTNYEEAFSEANSWMSQQSTSDFDNVTYFLSDGSPTIHNTDSGVSGASNDTSFSNVSQGVDAYHRLASISQVEAVGIGDDVNREILKVVDNTTVDGKLELVPIPLDTGALVNEVTLATFAAGDTGSLGQSNDWEKTSGSGSVSIERNLRGEYLRIADTGTTDGATTVVSDSFVVPMTASDNDFYSIAFTYETSNSAPPAVFHVQDHFVWRVEQLEDNGSWVTVANSFEPPVGSSLTTQIMTNSLKGGTYRLAFDVENMVNSGEFVLAVHNIEQNLYSYTDDELVPAGEDLIVNSAEEFETALDGGSSSDVPQEVGNDHLIGGAGDDILFGDQIEPAGVGGEAGSGYDGLVDHLTRQNGAEPTQEETLDFIKANYDKLIDTTRTDGGQDRLEGGQGDDQLFASANDDILIGGAGDDFLLGGLGSDTFEWNLGDAGSATDPALDVVSDFHLKDPTLSMDPEADKLSLGDLLNDFDSSSTDPEQSALDSFVFAQEENGDTVLYIKSDGGLDDQHGNADQKITLSGVSMDGQSSEAFLTMLRNNGQLDVE